MTVTGAAMRNLERAGVVATGVQLLRASSLEMSRPEWTWQDRIPANAVSLLAGMEGLGKTLIAFDLAARLTRGQLEGNRRGVPGDVVYVGLEDDWQSISVPRLVAAGGDLDRIHFLSLTSGGVFSVEADLPALVTALEPIADVAAIVVDPLDSHLGENVDSHRKSEVQRSVQRLAALAQEQACALIGIGHLNKNELSRDVLMRIIGSKGFTTSARSVLAVGEHPEEDRDRLLVLRKSNFGDASSVAALRFRPEKCSVPHPDGGSVETARIVWLGEEHDIDADSILAPKNAEERSEREAAAEWLGDLLADGAPLPYKAIERLASEAGIARATLHRARSLAAVEVVRDMAKQGRPSSWRLSSQSQTQHIETKDVTPLTRENASNNGLSSHISESKDEGTKPPVPTAAAATFGAFAVCSTAGCTRHTQTYLEDSALCVKCLDAQLQTAVALVRDELGGEEVKYGAGETLSGGHSRS